MWDNLTTDGDKTGGDRNVLLWKYAENSMDGSRNQQGSLKENGSEKNTYTHNEKELKYLTYIMKKEGLENLTLTGHIEGK